MAEVQHIASPSRIKGLWVPSRDYVHIDVLRLPPLLEWELLMVQSLGPVPSFLVLSEHIREAPSFLSGGAALVFVPTTLQSFRSLLRVLAHAR